MKVSLLSHSDGRGGAYAAAYRLHKGLLEASVNSTMLVGIKTRNDPTVVSFQNQFDRKWVKLAPYLDVLPNRLYPQRYATPYSLQWVPDKLAYEVNQIVPDIINLHWVNAGYLKIENFAKFTQPIVWTLHDMWAFTGGCHYNQDCNRYIDTCGACPQLNSSKEQDISRWVWQRKRKAWDNLNISIVTPSRWLAKCARSSSLLKSKRIEVIPYGIDTEKYKPIDKFIARNMLGLSKDKKFILFGAIKASSDRRKGFHLLEAALNNLSQTDWTKQAELIIFGASESSNSPKLAFKTHYLGRLNDDTSIALAYAAADVFVAPSIQDNLPNTVMESLACGTPCVAFDIGGMPDMVENLKNGYLAKPFDVEDLARGIVWVLEDEERFQKLSCQARQKVEREFTQNIQPQKYLSLFNDILSTVKYDYIPKNIHWE